MSERNDNDQFAEFISQISPAIREMVDKIEKSSDNRLDIKSAFRKVFLSESRDGDDRRLDSISTVIAVLIYDFLSIGIKTQKSVTNILVRESRNKEFSKIITSISANNLDIPLFNSSIFPVSLLIEFFLSNSHISDACVKFLQVNTRDSISYTEMKLPYFFERSVGRYEKQVLGQVFTPVPIVDFIFKQVISSDTEIIIDPAAGTGVFLLRSLKNIISYSYTRVRKIIAIERDPLLSLICDSAMKLLCKFHSIPIECTVYNQDLFASGSILKGLRYEKAGSISILMNPPYTRQESIPAKEKEYIKSQVSSTSVISRFMQKYTSSRISGQSSLYIYFILFISEFLNPGDCVGIIIPNSWMDVRYGSTLQLFILENYYIDLLVSTNLEKLIPSVDVNTVIMTLKLKSNEQHMDINSSSHQVNFIKINSIADLKHLTSNNIPEALSMIPGSVFLPVKESSLLQEQKWGMFAKAPQFYLDILEKNNKQLNRLKDHASVRRGFTSGANEFFYVGKPGKTNRFFISSDDPNEGFLRLKPLNKEILAEFQSQGFLLERDSFTIEREYWMHIAKNIDKIPKNSVSYTFSTNETWIPNFLVKSPKELESYKITSDKLDYIVLIIPKEEHIQLKPGIREYIKWGETWKPSKGTPYALRITCANRKYWYSLPEEHYQFCPILCIMTINDRYPFFYNPQNYYFDARFYGISPRSAISQDDEILMVFLFLYLNTVFVSFQIELSGRKNLGEGGLDVKVYEYKDIKIPSFEIRKNQSFLFSLFQQVVESVPSSYMKVEHPPSKQPLDLFLKEIYSFSDDYLSKLHEALRESVQARIKKAKTDFSYVN